MVSARKAVLITGASTGIGASSALRLAERGWRVFAGVRREEDARRLATRARGELEPVLMDVTEPASVARALGEVRDGTEGVLDGLVNNAGIVVAGPVECVAPEDWRRQFEVNVFGAVAVTRAALPMLRRARGRIVNVSSVSGRIVTPMLGPYCASKFAVEAISDALRIELREQGVRVALIEPGAVDTPIWAKSLGAAAEREARYPAEATDLYGRQIAKLHDLAESAARAAMPVDKAVRAIVHALSAKRPRIRYLLGRDARLGVAIRQLLPDAWWDALLARQMR